MFIVIDTETTGLPRKMASLRSKQQKCPRMVAIAWIECEREGEILADYYFIIKPDCYTIPEQATAIHGITTKNAQEEGKQLVSVLEIFQKSLKNSSFIVGHNVDFDIQVIAAEASRTGISLPIKELPRKCTMKASTRECKIWRGSGYKYPSLGELYYRLFGVPLPGHHHALSDASSCMKCYFELKKRGIL
ncbi:MAG: DNA polymerase III subunit epsilon [Methanoregulaceae archaeon PtaU1.Bin222]|nr:MAG: DNA polymerase III subunit epsilon [Methanoregulaceae archaeon PtaU1.Bin222]